MKNKVYPQILVFSCNWNGWSCIEAVTNMGLNYPASIKIIQVNCLSRVHIGLILRAFDLGAEGVMLLGCEPGKCRFCNDSKYITCEYNKTKDILEMLGIWKNRLILVQLPAFDGNQFVTEIFKLVTEIEQIPASRRSKIVGSGTARDIYIQPWHQNDI